MPVPVFQRQWSPLGALILLLLCSDLLPPLLRDGLSLVLDTPLAVDSLVASQGAGVAMPRSHAGS